MNMKEKKLDMIGNAHLDPVWLWNWQEGFQEAKATFRSALDRMKEDPDFVFSCSQAAVYEWIENNCPEMFKEIQDRVQEGRWELVGGWWIQPDCNIPCGESFARQGLYGQRYFLSRFGKIAETGYNVDSFGHHSNLPQILRKSGMKNYVFMRPMPMEKGLPSRIFHWRSMDGSDVMTYRIPYEYNSWGKDLERYTERLQCELEDGENELMQFYGVGNHGGGPTRENIRSIHRMDEDPSFPHMKMTTISSFFESIARNGRCYPVYEGDLQHHASGCYAANGRIKEANRRSEEKLLEAEKWCSVADIVEKQKYPADFSTAWKDVLFNQFHDILAGTCIKSACDDACFAYGEATIIGQRDLNYALQAISWDINIEQDVAMKPIVVFNSQAWSGKMIVTLEMRGLSSDDFYLYDDQNQLVPAQRISSEATVNGQSKLLFVANLPAMGYAVFRLYMKTGDAPAWENVPVNDKCLENDRFKLEFSEVTGYLTRLYDKQEDVEVLRSESGRLKVLEDPYDTWAHDIYKFDKNLTDMKLVSRKVIESGPVRSTIRMKYQYNNSLVWQDFSLYKEMNFIDVHVKCDWKEPRTMLKVAYSLACNFRKPTYEVPFGYLERNSNGEEEPGQTWIDVTGEYNKKPVIYGMAIANTSKYSYSVDLSEINLTLLRNCVYAHHNPKTLDGDLDEYDFIENRVQEFTYRIIPHRGTWKDAHVIQRAAELNTRPETIIETYHKGNLPLRKSFLSLESDHIVLTAMKQSEEGDGIIIRAYESKRQSGDAILRAEFMNRTETLHFEPCEIKTIFLPYDSEKSMQEVNILEMNPQ